MGSKLGLLKRLLHMEFFRPSSEAEMLKVMQERQYRFIADSNHFSEPTQAGVSDLAKKFGAISKCIAFEAPPKLVQRLVCDLPVARLTYVDGNPIQQADVLGLAQRVKVADRQGIVPHGVDVAAQFEQLASPRMGEPLASYTPEAISARLNADRRVAATIQQKSHGQPMTVVYGAGHMGRTNSIDAFLPKDQVGIVGVFSDRKFLHASAHEVDVLKGTNTEQRSLVEWMDFIKLEDTGEVFMNDALRQQRSNPSQHRIIPIAKLKP